MLPYKVLGRLPAIIRFARNGKALIAERALLGKLLVTNRRIHIADAEMMSEFPPLPVTIPNGEYDVFTYHWLHSTEPITVCVVIVFRPQRWAISRRLTMPNRVRPDLDQGVIVDFGAIAIQGENTLTIDSGDGYFPIYVNYNLAFWPQSLILDFKLWESRKLILPPGRRLDEFGIPIDERM